MTQADADFITFLTVMKLSIEIMAYTLLAGGAFIWIIIQYMKFTNIRDTGKRQRILDDINRKIAEDNLKDAQAMRGPETWKPVTPAVQYTEFGKPSNVTSIARKRGDGIWEPNKR